MAGKVGGDYPMGSPPPYFYSLEIFDVNYFEKRREFIRTKKWKINWCEFIRTEITKTN